MQSKTRRSAAILAVLLHVSALTASERPPVWPDESYTRQLVEGVLPKTSQPWDGYEFAQRGSRGATYIAAGLLWRDGSHDREAAAAVLRGVLDLQYKDEPIQFLVWAPDLDEAAITRDRWNLPGLRVAVEVADGVTLQRVRWIDHPRYGRCLEVRYSTPAEMVESTQAIALRPER
ncbi:MAG: hypothetical protein HQ581_21400 [Planctomycetes bacterium]|nr:hypothetical protein [Planctomycetota bacterium]